MSFEFFVQGNISVQPAPVTPEPLDLEILGVTLTAPQDALWGATLIKEVALDSWQQTLEDVGIVDGDPVFEYVQLFFFGNQGAARALLLGKRATPVAQITNFDLGDAGAAVDGLYRITLEGTNFDKVASSETRADVVAALIALIAADPLYGAAAGGDAEQLDANALNPGVPFGFAASAPVGESWTATTTTPNVGLTTDLGAWEAERQDWYLVTRVESTLFDEANAFGQALGSFERDITGWLRTDSAGDPLAAVPADPTRVAARLAAFGYQRLVITHVPTATDYDWARLTSYRLAETPGVALWSNWLIEGVDGEKWTTTQSNALKAGPYAFFDQVRTLDGGIAAGVRTVGGIPFDVVRGGDYLLATMLSSILTALLREDRIGMTPEGYAEIGGIMSSDLDGFVKTGFLAATRPDGSLGYSVTIPEVPAPGSPDRVAGIARGFKFEALTTGGIEVVRDLTGILIL